MDFQPKIDCWDTSLCRLVHLLETILQQYVALFHPLLVVVGSKVAVHE